MILKNRLKLIATIESGHQMKTGSLKNMVHADHHTLYENVHEKPCVSCGETVHPVKMKNGKFEYICKQVLNGLRLLSVTHDGKTNLESPTNHTCNENCELKYNSSGFLLGCIHSGE